MKQDRCTSKWYLGYGRRHSRRLRCAGKHRALKPDRADAGQSAAYPDPLSCPSM